MLYLQKRRAFVFSKHFFYEMKRLLSIKERNETEILRFFILFSKM